MKLASYALAAALAVSAGAALAQSPAQPGPQGPAPRHMQRMDPAQRTEAHAQRLRDVLQLRPDQEPALRAFLAARQPDRARMAERRGDRGQRAQLTTPQRLDLQAERMAERQARFRQVADATKRFYAQLSPTQQKAFDAMHQGRGHRGKMGRGRMGPDHRGHGQMG